MSHKSGHPVTASQPPSTIGSHSTRSVARREAELKASAEKLKLSRRRTGLKLEAIQAKKKAQQAQIDLEASLEASDVQQQEIDEEERHIQVTLDIAAEEEADEYQQERSQFRTEDWANLHQGLLGVERADGLSPYDGHIGAIATQDPPSAQEGRPDRVAFSDQKVPGTLRSQGQYPTSIQEDRWLQAEYQVPGTSRSQGQPHTSTQESGWLQAEQEASPPSGAVITAGIEVLSLAQAGSHADQHELQASTYQRGPQAELHQNETPAAAQQHGPWASVHQHEAPSQRNGPQTSVHQHELQASQNQRGPQAASHTMKQAEPRQQHEPRPSSPKPPTSYRRPEPRASTWQPESQRRQLDQWPLQPAFGAPYSSPFVSEDRLCQALGAPPPACGVKAGGAVDLAPALPSAADRNVPVADFADPCDNSDYQWFLEYNPLLRESSCHHTSVLSSLSASYKGIGDLTSRFDFSSRYDDLARDLDANLAEADMESFKTEDIHALLMTANLPHDTIVQHDEHDSNRRGEMFASISSSLMEKFRFDSSMSPPSSSQGDSTAGSINTMSLCKSELLFSPVRDAPHPAVHFSIDSLDCDLLNEQDLILTCQANKDNYTIAFEGSLTTYSEDSELGDAAVNETNDNIDKLQERITSTLYNATKSGQKNVAILQPGLEQSRPYSMAKSDTGFTTWSKLKKQSGPSPKRHPSGNNNGDSGNSNDLDESVGGEVLKSQSLPDLFRKRMRSSMLSNTSTSTIESFCQQRDGYMKVYNVSQTQPEAMSTSSDANTDQRQGFSLVKLFMKQKSASNEGMATDHSGSECWPNSSEGESGDSFGPEKKHNDLQIYESDRSNNENIYEELAQSRTDYMTKFEDSLQRTSKTNEMCADHIYNTTLIEEEDMSQINEESKAMCDSDSNLYATVNKPLHRKMNVNNNNVLERNAKCHSPMRFRSNLSRKSCSSMSSGTISSCSESEGTQLTKLQRITSKDMFENKATSTRLPYNGVDRSMQTSLQASSYTKDSGLVKVVVPSFLEKLKRGGCEKPVYVLYPNYTLPDLSFMNEKDSYENIMLKPQKFNHVEDKIRKKKSVEMLLNRRPFSCNDIESLRKKGFGHIRDWDSLTFLLPTEYKKLLSEVPEVVQKLKEQESEATKFNKTTYVTPHQARHKARPASCDCNNLGHNPTNVSSSSSTATQPSSGYRGSSTMLTDSSAQNSPAPVGNFNPLFVYRYDSATSSEASFLTHDRQKTNPPRRSVSVAEHAKISANGKIMEAVPPRPPLPKSILRKSAEKLRKNTINTKRYSMFEMDELIQDPVMCLNVETEQKLTKRRSLQEPYYLLKNNSIEMRKNAELASKRMSRQFSEAVASECNEYFCDEGVGTESSLDSAKSNDIKTVYRPRTPPLPKPRMRSSGTDPMVFPPAGTLISSADLQQLEQLLSQSGVSCQNMDEWDHNQMQKVRNRVSKFLSMKRSHEENERSTDSSSSSSNSRKSVSFAKKVDRKKNSDNSLKVIKDVKVASVSTPPNSPNMNAAISQRQYQAKNLSELPICEEGEVSPESCSPARQPSNSSQRVIDISQKRALVSRVTDAVEVIIHHFSAASDQSQLGALGDSERSPEVARLALNALCPALYAVFRDGLRDTIQTSFGAANNSVWQIVEASARQGPITKALNELVLRINSEDAISEGLVKFNAFILGLLNAHSVDAWVSYIRTRESILHKHYHPSSLLHAACTGDAGCKALLDTLLASLEPLGLLPFRLDLLHEMRQLQRSLQRIGPQPSPHRPAHINLPSLTVTQRNLLKLVHSVQSSIVSSDDQRDGSSSVGSVIMRHKPEPSTPDLLNDSVGTKTLCSVDRVRPRSCVNPSTAPSADCPSNSRIEIEQNRRWSGVQLGSKLIQAFDRLVMYDDSDEYTDSLENQKAGGNSEHVSEERLNRKYNSSCGSGLDSCGECEPETETETCPQAAPPRATFRRLQLRWEMLSNGDSSPSGEQSPVTSRGSKIPRPVTSPSRPHAPALTSPARTQHRGIPVAVKKTSPTTPPGPPGTPNSRVAATARAKLVSPAAKRPGTTPSRASRADQPAGSATSTPRPASLPHGRTLPAPPPARRAASTDLARGGPPSTTTPPNKKVQTHKPKMVRTLWHRLPSDSGHLAFNEGERLRLVLEVDQQWLLCCRGDRKGLVPRNAVISVHDS